jgi:hypothetical protein
MTTHTADASVSRSLLLRNRSISRSLLTRIPLIAYASMHMRQHTHSSTANVDMYGVY